MPLHTAQPPVCKIEVHQAKPVSIMKCEARWAILTKRARNHLCEICQRMFLLHYACCILHGEGAYNCPICKSARFLMMNCPCKTALQEILRRSAYSMYIHLFALLHYLPLPRRANVRIPYRTIQARPSSGRACERRSAPKARNVSPTGAMSTANTASQAGVKYHICYSITHWAPYYAH